MSSISISSFMASFVFSVIGIWLFREGKRRSEVRLMLIAMAMMTYTYFTATPLADWGIGLGLCGLTYYLWV
jgi:hypothetical protein